MAEKREKIGRPRKYGTDLSFRKAVEGYFASISREVVVKDDKGNTEVNDAGEPIKRTQYIVPPSMSGLMLHLGITKKTWSNYANSDNEVMAWICDRAKARIEAYLEEQLLTRQKGIQGVIFNLSANYHWKEKREIEVGTETRKALAASAMTMEEKMKLIKAAAAECDDGGAGE